MRDLNEIPYDIWELIFQHVCTDGGLSGCSLALVSKSFRALSASARFHSLTLSSVFQVKSFLICFERIRRYAGGHPLARTSSDASDSNDRTPPQAPIHHLLLSFLADTCDAPQRTVRKWTHYARDERSLVFQLAHDHRTWAEHKRIWNAHFVLHVSRLLQLAAPTLRSLLVLQSPAVRLPLVSVRLPVLRELTMLGDDRMFIRAPGPGALVPGQNDDSDFAFYGVVPPLSDALPQNANANANSDEEQNDKGDEGPPFPALTHLHVVFAGPKLHPWEQTLPRWAALAPHLTHLRASQANVRLLPALGEMLGVPPAPLPPDEDEAGEGPGVGGAGGGGTRALSGSVMSMSGSALTASSALPGEPPRPATYPSLRVVVVQMCGARKTNAGVDLGARELERVRDECAMREEEREGARVLLLRSRAYMPGYWDARLAWDWAERMCGGGGCWTGDEGDEDVWKFARGEGEERRLGKRRRRKASAVDMRELLRESSEDSAEAGGTAQQPMSSTKRWWKVLANGIQRVGVKRRSS